MYRYLLCFSLGIVSFACSAPKKPAPTDYITVEGQAQGTYYRITYADSLQRNFKPDFEAFFDSLNQEVSTYEENSLISAFNRSTADTFVVPTKPGYFMANLEKSLEVFRSSQGAFDPTVMPLVAYWGFGPKPNQLSAVDTTKVDSLLQFVGLEKLTWTRQADGRILVRKARPGIQLDFNAIAQGYAVDEIGRMLEARGIIHYLADIGGEVLAKGKNPRGQAWTIGINAPREDGKSDEILAAVPLENRALATSGNYRKFYEVEGVKFSHTIHPKTGFPERNALLSASVFAPDAMSADAYATACMVLGPEKALTLIQQHPELDAYLIIGTSDGKMEVRYSVGLKALFEKK
jgi:thiamine biosynthesis lipoprotein